MSKNELNKDPLNTEIDEFAVKEKVPKKNIYEVVQIYDTTCNKIRNARNFQISSFEGYDENGAIKLRKSVEFIIVGKNRTWKMFVPYDEFKNANPDVNLPGESN